MRIGLGMVLLVALAARALAQEPGLRTVTRNDFGFAIDVPAEFEDGPPPHAVIAKETSPRPVVLRYALFPKVASPDEMLARVRAALKVFSLQEPVSIDDAGGYTFLRGSKGVGEAGTWIYCALFFRSGRGYLLTAIGPATKSSTLEDLQQRVFATFRLTGAGARAASPEPSPAEPPPDEPDPTASAVAEPAPEERPPAAPTATPSTGPAGSAP